MAKVTYLLGAGASCLCLPTVDKIPGRLKEFKEHIENVFQAIPDKVFKFSNSKEVLDSVDLKKTILDELDELREKVKSHLSIDTYAKKLDVSRNRNLFKFNSLKILLSFSFIYDQIRFPVDLRYDAFFASLIKNSYHVLADVRIVSWNYDYQIEKAYSSYSNYESLLDNQKILDISPLISNVNSEHVDKFSIFKLNGTTSFEQTEDIPFKTPFDNLDLNIEELGTQLGEKLLEYFFEVNYNSNSQNRWHPTLSFAWENKPLNKKVLDNAKRSIAGSEALVIIGYSFPFFNREIDKQIIQALDNKCMVYIEDPNFSNIKSNLNSIRAFADGQVFEVKNLDQFFLPPQL